MNKIQNKYLFLYVCLVLVLATLAVYLQVREHEFIQFDDELYILENDNVKAGLTKDGIIWAFTKSHAYNWHPLTWLSHMLDVSLFGLEPGAHHIMNVAFHIVNTLLLFFVLKQMTGSLWASALVAGLFALHPLHVESVAWASERKDVLSTFFWLLTMICYLKYTEQPSIARYIAVILVFCLGLMAKQMLVTIPFVLLLLDYWPLRRLKFKGQNEDNLVNSVISVSLGRCILEKLPLLFFSVLAAITVYLVQGGTGIMKAGMGYPVLYRAMNAAVAYVTYIQKMFWPTNLAIFYPHKFNDLSQWQLLLSILVLVYATKIVLQHLKDRPYLAVGWLWYLVTLVPVIGLIQVGEQAMADRYTYIPLIGLFIMIAWGIPDILACLHLPSQKAIMSVSAVVLVALLGITTWGQVKHWQNNATLFKHATKAVADNWWAYGNLALMLSRQDKLEESNKYWRQTLRICPDSHVAHNNLGHNLFRQNKFDEAIEHYMEALRIKADFPTALANLVEAQKHNQSQAE